MFKKVLSVIALAFALGLSFTSISVFAEGENGIMPINETSETTPISDTSGEIAEPTDEGADNTAIDLEAGNTPDTDKAEEPENEEDAGEPETWPMYVSLGALGLAVLIFIILNLLGRKKR